MVSIDIILQTTGQILHKFKNSNKMSTRKSPSIFFYKNRYFKSRNSLTKYDLEKTR